MGTVNFAFTTAVLGIGGTLLSLWLLSLMIDLLKWLFPHRETGKK